MMDNKEKMELIEHISLKLNEMQQDFINLVADVHLLERNIISEGI